MLGISTIGLDLAKQVFQLHGAAASGGVVFRKQVRRGELLKFLSGIDRCVVAMEACGSAHHWGRAIAKLGHDVRLIAPIYVKPFVKRQKNDAADAEAICEAAQRPTMRFVPVKSEAAQAAGVVFRTRDLLVRQRTQAINALRGHLAEFGIVAPRGTGHVATLIERLRAADTPVPQAARIMLDVLVDTLAALEAQVARLDREIARRAREDADARRLMTIPGVGPVTATALVALAPAPERFARGRDFAAWLGLTPLQHSTGGKQRLGRTSKMGERSLRRLLIIGASAVVCQAARRGAPAGSWLAHARDQAADAGHRRARQQNGAHRLGDDGPATGLPSSGSGITPAAARRQQTQGQEVEGRLWRYDREIGSVSQM